MSQTDTSSEYSADESGYVCSRPRRIPTVTEDYDLSEDSEAATHHTPIRSPTRELTPPALEQPQQLTRGPRIRVTARKSVPIPIRRTFRIPLRDEAGPSNYRDRSTTSSSSSSASFESQGATIKRHNRDIYALVKLLGTNKQELHRITEVVDHTKTCIQQLYMIVYLLMVVLVVMLGCLMLRTIY